MGTWELVGTTLLYGLLFWLGWYVIARDVRQPLLWFTGLALLALAGSVGAALLTPYAFSIGLAPRLLRAEQLFILLAALFGLAAMIALAPGYAAWWQRLQQQKGNFLLAWFCLIGFGLSAGFLMITGNAAPGVFHLWLMGLWLAGLGTAVTRIVAGDQGEAWLPHYLRSFDYSFFTALLFGGQVALIMVYAVGATLALLLLLLGTISAAILVQVFSDPVQATLDQVAFFNRPGLRRQRSALRAESGAAQRVDASLDMMQIEEAEFAKHTRRALSHMGDLPRLAASPLTHLPLVTVRVAQNGRYDSTLVRANELKRILTESIARLKPPGDEPFGTTDAWRHYNALYFPYVLGLRPYSRRFVMDDTFQGETAVQDALAWFRAQVPERTLYNWQNAAAQLVARDLRERSRHL